MAVTIPWPLVAMGVGEVHSTGTVINDGLWHHVTVSFVDSSNTLTLFIDGVSSGSGILNLAADVAGHVIKVGNNGGSYFRGQMDEFQIYNRALSQSEIQGLMSTAILPPASTPSPTPTLDSIQPHAYPDSNTDHNANADTNCDFNAQPNTDFNARADIDAHAKPGIDPDPNAGTYFNSHLDADTSSDTTKSSHRPVL